MELPRDKTANKLSRGRREFTHSRWWIPDMKVLFTLIRLGRIQTCVPMTPAKDRLYGLRRVRGFLLFFFFFPRDCHDRPEPGKKLTISVSLESPTRIPYRSTPKTHLVLTFLWRSDGHPIPEDYAAGPMPGRVATTARQNRRSFASEGFAVLKLRKH